MGVYVRKERRANSRTYYWLVTSYREDGKVRQKKLKYMGIEEPTSDEVDSAKAQAWPKLATGGESGKENASGRPEYSRMVGGRNMKPTHEGRS